MEAQSITAPNIPGWCGIVALVLAIVGGVIWLRSIRHRDVAVILLLLIPLPVVVCAAGTLLLGILYFVVSIIGHLLGHGRVN